MTNADRTWKFEKMLWPVVTLAIGGIVGGAAGFYASHLGVQKQITLLSMKIGAGEERGNSEDGLTRDINELAKQVGVLEEKIPMIAAQLEKHQETVGLLAKIDQPTQQAIRYLVESPSNEPEILVALNRKLQAFELQDGVVIINAPVKIRPNNGSAGLSVMGAVAVNGGELSVNDGPLSVTSGNNGTTRIDGSWVSATSGSEIKHKAAFRVFSRPDGAEETQEQSQRRMVAVLAENNYGPNMQNGGSLELKTTPGAKVQYNEGLGFFPSTNGARYRQVRLINAERPSEMPGYTPVLSDEKGNISVAGFIKTAKGIALADPTNTDKSLVIRNDTNRYYFDFPDGGALRVQSGELNGIRDPNNPLLYQAVSLWSLMNGSKSKIRLFDAN